MLATACVVVPVASGRITAASSRTARATLAAPVDRVWHDKAGLTVRYPAGWHVGMRNVTPITEPVPRFVIYSGATPRPVATAGPRADQVLAVVMEQTPVSAADLRRDYPQRPRRFTVHHFGGVEGFAGERWTELVFRDNGRAFYLFIGVGVNANRQLPPLLEALDTLRVAA